jgi:hypothetical protein
MSEEPFALSKISPALPAPDAYDTICTTLMHTERGRWFLQEYARRNRSADTQVLLGAIKRIESVVRAERDRQANQSLRSGLLEMAEAITRTQAEVAEIGSQTPPGLDSAGPGNPASPGTPRSESGDIFAAAERIRDVTWAMRGRGFDPSTCSQIEELAASILSASSLRDPNDRRIRKLSEVLRHLEHRIDVLLESCTEGAASARLTYCDDGEPTAAGDAGSDPPSASASVTERSGPSHPAEPDRAEARSRTSDALLPAVELLDSGELLPQPPEAGPALPAAPEGPASALLGAIDSRAALWDFSEPARAPAQPAAEPTPQPPPNDPLAALKAMSDIERIALFT